MRHRRPAGHWEVPCRLLRSSGTKYAHRHYQGKESVPAPGSCWFPESAGDLFFYALAVGMALLRPGYALFKRHVTTLRIGWRLGVIDGRAGHPRIGLGGLKRKPH